MALVNQSVLESALAKSETSLRFQAGETLFREGETPTGVHIVHTGSVHLLFAARNGQAKPLRIAHPGQILGLSCLVTQRPYDCTATARTACEVGFIEREEFLRVLQESPAVWFSVLRFLSSEVTAVYDDIRALAAR